MKNYVKYKHSKRSRKRRASEGMTAAIILIAFIITAAGIAFVILTMGSEMQLELGDVGEEGKDAASSALQVEGGIVSGYGVTDSGEVKIHAYAFNLKLVLGTGRVDLSSDAITVWLQVGSGEEEEKTVDSSATYTLAYFANNLRNGSYGINWYNNDTVEEVLDPDEMARFFIGASQDGAGESSDITIIINSGVAVIKIEKTIPIGLVTGLNYL